MSDIDIRAYRGSELRVYPSGVDINSDFMTIYIEINLLGKMVAEWKKNNPNIDFGNYTHLEEPTNETS